MSSYAPTAPAALAQRLAVVHEAITGQTASASAIEAGPMDVLVQHVELLRETRDTSHAWLLATALSGAMPEPAIVHSITRGVTLQTAEIGAVWLLDELSSLALRAGNATARMRLVCDRPLIDVDATAKSDFLTGIQRVVRGVVAQWQSAHDVEFVVWASRGGAYRSVSKRELDRLLDDEVGQFDASVLKQVTRSEEIVVPWGVPVVLTEVPSAGESDRLAALAELTGSSLRLVGYDCIPISSAETVSLAEPEKFGRYLELVKVSDRIAGISRTAAAEFDGFVQALAVQGLPGPTVVACPLPHTLRMNATPVTPESGPDDDATPVEEISGEEPVDRPLVVCIGSIGVRKNQVSLVEAAEHLWREGIDFELRLLGHVGAERTPLTGLVPELQALGRPLVVESGVSDARIVESLNQARCLVFPSLHEGFGLPVVEALSHGTPVITSDYGAPAEVAAGQGGLLVDPTDVFALAGALRELLTDDGLHAELVAQAASRPVRSWSEYARELWEELLG